MRHTLIAIALLLISLDADAQATRDSRGVAGAGTGTIAGTVMLESPDRQPVRRARVTLNSADRTVGRTVITDDAGAFAFGALPPGRYTLAATKDAYVTAQYGAKGYGRQGTPIVLAEGEQVRGLVLKIPRGSVITGTLLDHDGQPLPGIGVRTMRFAFLTGERRLIPAGSMSTTDDRGVYRLYGLPAGEYVVVASMSSGPVPFGEVRLLSEADVQRALEEADRAGSAVQRTPGIATVAAGGPIDDSERTGTYAAVFYPGTTNAAQAAVVTVSTAEEKSGIDFQVQMVPTARIEGSVTAPEGVPLQGTSVTLMASSMVMAGNPFEGFKITRTDAEGRFTFSGVTPGQYTIMVRAAAPRRPAADASASPPPAYWAMTEVSVDGVKVSGLALTLLPALSISGRVRFEGTTQPPSDMRRIRIVASLVQSAAEVNLGAMPVQADESGAFTLSGLSPGKYRVTATIAGNRPDGTAWTLRSAMVSGRDTLDFPVELRQNVDGATLTFTDRACEIAGTVLDERGQPAPEYTVIIFAKDPAFWTPGSRRVATVRPAPDGKFTARSLPPGDYLVTAVLDMETGQTGDTAFLQQLATSAIAVTLGEGEKKTQDLQVASRTDPR